MLPLALAQYATDAFDSAYSPRLPTPLSVRVSALPTNGKLYAADDSTFARLAIPMSTAELPRTLPGGLAWYQPPQDVFTTDGVRSDVESMRYFATDCLGQDSVPGVVSFMLHAVNDAPRATPMSIAAYVGVSRVFTLQASDVDSSMLSTATLRNLPGHGSLTFAASGRPVVVGQPFDIGAELSYLCDLNATARAMTSNAMTAAMLRGASHLRSESFEFTVCDRGDETVRNYVAQGGANSNQGGVGAQGAMPSTKRSRCSETAAVATLQVLNHIQARDGTSEVAEDVASVVQLAGADYLGRRVSLQLMRGPAHGILYQCMPTGNVAPAHPASASFGGHPTNRNEQLPDCCLPPHCSPSRIADGEHISDSIGRLVYLPARDYFNCKAVREQRDGRRGGANVADPATSAIGTCADHPVGLPPDELVFAVFDEEGQRSANATLWLWVRNTPDMPLVLGSAQLKAEVLDVTPLPALQAIAPDGDWVSWEVELAVTHGVITLNQKHLAPLAFLRGDGSSDRAMVFHATALQLNAALHGAAYRATIVAHDVLRIRIADRAGEAALTPPSGTSEVHITVSAAAVADIEAVVVSWDIQAHSCESPSLVSPLPCTRHSISCIPPSASCSARFASPLLFPTLARSGGAGAVGRRGHAADAARLRGAAALPAGSWLQKTSQLHTLSLTRLAHSRPSNSLPPSPPHPHFPSPFTSSSSVPHTAHHSLTLTLSHTTTATSATSPTPLTPSHPQAVSIPPTPPSRSFPCPPPRSPLDLTWQLHNVSRGCPPQNASATRGHSRYTHLECDEGSDEDVATHAHGARAADASAAAGSEVPTRLDCSTSPKPLPLPRGPMTPGL